MWENFTIFLNAKKFRKMQENKQKYGKIKQKWEKNEE